MFPPVNLKKRGLLKKYGPGVSIKPFVSQETKLKEPDCMSTDIQKRVSSQASLWVKRPTETPPLAEVANK
jgi:hypothetical protein